MSAATSTRMSRTRTWLQLRVRTRLADSVRDIVHEHPCTREIEIEISPDKTLSVQRRLYCGLVVRRADQEHEAATAGPGDLASKSTGLAGGRIGAVDRLVANSITEALLGRPGFIHDRTNLLHLTGNQSIARHLGRSLDGVELLQVGVLGVSHASLLIPKNHRGIM